MSECVSNLSSYKSYSPCSVLDCKSVALMVSHLSPLCCPSGSLGWVTSLLCPRLCSEGSVCFLLGWTAVYFRARIMPLLLLAVNSKSTSSCTPKCQHWDRLKHLAELTGFFPCLWKCCSTLLTNTCYRWKLTHSSSEAPGFSLALILLSRHDFTSTLLPRVQDLEGMLVFCSHL